MTAIVWLERAHEELNELAPEARNDPADAWRALVLLARLLDSPIGSFPIHQLVPLAPEWLEVAGPSDPELALDAVADALTSTEDPWGPLLDGLLDVDDTLGVLKFEGRADDAGELSRRVAALVALRADRVLTLVPFASMRLETLRVDSPTAAVWGAVERAPAEILVEALPPVGRQRDVPETHASSDVTIMLPDEFLRPAASSHSNDIEWPLEVDSPGCQAWLYEEDGEIQLEITGLNGGMCVAVIIAERITDAIEVSRREIKLVHQGESAYSSLGPKAGRGSLMHDVAREGGVGAGDLRIRIQVFYE